MKRGRHENVALKVKSFIFISLKRGEKGVKCKYTAMCMYITYKSSVVLTMLHYVVKWTNEEKWCDGATVCGDWFKIAGLSHEQKKCIITRWCLDRALYKNQFHKSCIAVALQPWLYKFKNANLALGNLNACNIFWFWEDLFLLHHHVQTAGALCITYVCLCEYTSGCLHLWSSVHCD